MDRLEESILSGLRYGLRENIPANTKALETANILNAIDLDDRFQLGIFSNAEKYAIITAEKEKYVQNNLHIKKRIKKDTNK